MTTLTIKQEDFKNIHCETAMDAIEILSELCDFKIIGSVTSNSMLEKLEQQYLETKNKPFETFENM